MQDTCFCVGGWEGGNGNDCSEYQGVYNEYCCQFLANFIKKMAFLTMFNHKKIPKSFFGGFAAEKNRLGVFSFSFPGGGFISQGLGKVIQRGEDFFFLFQQISAQGDFEGMFAFLCTVCFTGCVFFSRIEGKILPD